MLDKADGSIYNEGTANTDEVFAAGRRWNGRSSAGQASCLPEKGPVLHGRTAGPEGMGMKQNRSCRLVCVLCALAFALTALPMAAFAQQPEETAAVQQSLTAADVRGMQQADAAVTAPLIVDLMTGSLVVEKIFAIPGVGSLLVTAIQSNDYNVVISLSFIYSAMYIGIMLVVDLLYGIIDPRIRLAKGDD